MLHSSFVGSALTCLPDSMLCCEARCGVLHLLPVPNRSMKLCAIYAHRRCWEVTSLFQCLNSNYDIAGSPGLSGGRSAEQRAEHNHVQHHLELCAAPRQGKHQYQGPGYDGGEQRAKGCPDMGACLPLLGKSPSPLLTMLYDCSALLKMPGMLSSPCCMTVSHFSRCEDSCSHQVVRLPCTPQDVKKDPNSRSTVLPQSWTAFSLILWSFSNQMASRWGKFIEGHSKYERMTCMRFFK